MPRTSRHGVRKKQKTLVSNALRLTKLLHDLDFSDKRTIRDCSFKNSGWAVHRFTELLAKDAKEFAEYCDLHQRELDADAKALSPEKE